MRKNITKIDRKFLFIVLINKIIGIILIDLEIHRRCFYVIQIQCGSEAIWRKSPPYRRFLTNASL